MSTADGLNYQFKQLLAGVPGDIAAMFGEALLALDAQRHNRGAEASGLLRKAYLALAKHLAMVPAAELTPQQDLFLLSGAVGDVVWVKNHTGERIQIPLLPAEHYQALLDAIDESSYDDLPAAILTPVRRRAALAGRKLEPLDLSRPGKYKEPTGDQAEPAAAATSTVNLREIEQSAVTLSTANLEMQKSVRRFTDILRADRLAPAMKELGELSQSAARIVEAAKRKEQPAAKDLQPDEQRHPLVQKLQALHRDLSGALTELETNTRTVLRQCSTINGLTRAIGTAEPKTTSATVETPSAGELLASPQLAKDLESTNQTVVQLLLNNPQRSIWSTSRVLLAEQTEKCNDPVEECYATPANLAAAIRKIDYLHPNCFVHDQQGNPILPPIIIEPGVGIVRWMDDRFILSFVCNEIARPGKDLTLSPVDLAVMQIYGLFLARGDIFNYRGERIFTNFMGEYAGEVESKATVKFTGAEKKMTYVSSAAEKDAASREDSVRDYIDFYFCVMNNLPLPKRISPRKVSVILKYCTIVDLQRTAVLVLRHVFPSDFQVAREILIKLAGRKMPALVALLEAAIQEDQQLALRFKRDIRRALEDVMGREYLQDVLKAEILGGGSGGQRDAESGDTISLPPESHDYFDV